MPLENAKPGTPGFSRNIATEVKAGKPEKQAVAIAYSKARGDSSRSDASFRKGDYVTHENNGKVGKVIEVDNANSNALVNLNAGGTTRVPSVRLKMFEAARSDADDEASIRQEISHCRKQLSSSGFTRKTKEELHQRLIIAERKLAARSDSSKVDCAFEEKGQFWFRKPGFREACGPYATEQEANEAAVKMGVVADAATPQKFNHDSAKEASIKNLLEAVKKANKIGDDKAPNCVPDSTFKKKRLSKAQAERLASKHGVKLPPQDDPRKGTEWVDKEGNKYYLSGYGGPFEGYLISSWGNGTWADAAAPQKFDHDADRSLTIWAARFEVSWSRAQIRLYTCVARNESEALRKCTDQLKANYRPGPGDKFKLVSIKNTGNHPKKHAVQSYGHAAFEGNQWMDFRADSDQKDAAGEDKPREGRRYPDVKGPDGKWYVHGTKFHKIDSKIHAIHPNNWVRGDTAEADIQVNWGAGKNVATGESGGYSWKITKDYRGNYECAVKKDGKRVFYSNAGKDPEVLVRKIEDYISSRKDSAEADATPTIVRQGDSAGRSDAGGSWLILNNGSTSGSAGTRHKTKAEAQAAAAKLRAKLKREGRENKYVEIIQDSFLISDSTPIIVREGDQWIIQLKNGAETSVFRISTKEYPTEAAALEYATTNPQYTNSKPTNILDSVMSAADELFRRAAKADAERDLPGPSTGEGGYSDGPGYVSKAKHEAEAKEWIVLNNGSTGGMAGTRHSTKAGAQEAANKLRSYLRKNGYRYNEVTVEPA